MLRKTSCYSANEAPKTEKNRKEGENGMPKGETRD